MRKKNDKAALLPAPIRDELVHRMELSRDEVYRIVNATYHSHLELMKTNAFAIRFRGNQYGRIATRMDEAYMKLIDCGGGSDARFDVQFFLKREKGETKVVAQTTEE